MFNVKLGKKAKKHDSRTLQFAAYGDALVPPPTADWSKTTGPLGMMLNDQYGDCTIAAVGHTVQSDSGANGSPLVAPDDVILGYYSRWDGYVIGDPSTDQGGVELDVLNRWRQEGFAFSGTTHSLLAFTEVNPKNHAHVKASIAFFGGIYIGVALPLTAQGQNEWTLKIGAPSDQSARGSWGGHAVPVVGYNEHGVFVITWGQIMFVSWAFWDDYVDEAYCLLLGNDWAVAGNKAPSGMDLATLQGDLKSVTA